MFLLCTSSKYVTLIIGLTEANSEYSSRLESRSSDKVLFNLGWKVDELSRLNKMGHTVMVELQSLLNSLSVGDLDTSKPEVRSQVLKLCETMSLY